jgi:lysophospholipase L1-like esterase
MRTRILVLAAGAAIAVLAVLPAGAAASATAPHYYLALGDSLSQGMQPDLNGVTRDTAEGYANDLLMIEQRRVHNLQLIQYGCGGDTTTSMLTGQGNATNAHQLHCIRTGGSQEAAAIRFLKAHHAKGEVPLITVDIGANDIDGCVTAPNVVSCVTQALATITTNLPKILSGLKKAAPAGTKFAMMNLYDPVLAGYFAPSGSSANTLAQLSLILVKDLNSTIATADTAGGFLTADVADAFDTFDMVTWEGLQIPVNVARVCSWTWACQTPPSGPNIHANKNGYQVIAHTFAAAIGRLH